MNFNEFGGLNSGILRTVNEALVLNLVRERQPISRVAIARTTGLKESTISSIVKELLEQNLIVETEFGDSGGGRRPLMLDLNRDRSRTIGVDFCVNGSHPDTWEYDYFDWCGLPLFHDPSGFGDLILTAD